MRRSASGVACRPEGLIECKPMLVQVVEEPPSSQAFLEMSAHSLMYQTHIPRWGTVLAQSESLWSLLDPNVTGQR